MTYLSGSKKGQTRNYFAVVAFLFAMGFLSIFGYLITSELINEYSKISLYDSTMAETASGFLLALQVIDYVMVLFVIVLIIGVGVTSYKINAPPVFFIVSIVMSVFLVIAAYIFNYAFAELVSNSIFNATLAFFPKTVLICQNLHWVALVAFAVGSITLFAKKEQGSFAQQ